LLLSFGTPGDYTPTTDPFVPRVDPAREAAVVDAASAEDALAEASSYVASEAGLPGVDAEHGVLVLPTSADSHRVYVDGKVTGVAPTPIVVMCGRHAVKVGSQGRDQSVVVPCGGSAEIAYP
jgi:hypothetical protein